MQNVCIPLGSLYLCLDCDCAGDNPRQCPGCASKALLTLANCLNRPETAELDFNAIYLLCRKDDPSLGLEDALQMAHRMYARPGLPGACIHRMPQGTSAFDTGAVCVRCGSKRMIPSIDPNSPEWEGRN